MLADGGCLRAQTRCRVIVFWHLHSKESNSGQICCFIKWSHVRPGTAWKLIAHTPWSDTGQVQSTLPQSSGLTSMPAASLGWCQEDFVLRSSFISLSSFPKKSYQSHLTFVVNALILTTTIPTECWELQEACSSWNSSLTTMTNIWYKRCHHLHLIEMRHKQGQSLAQGHTETDAELGFILKRFSWFLRYEMLMCLFKKKKNRRKKNK